MPKWAARASPTLPAFPRWPRRSWSPRAHGIATRWSTWKSCLRSLSWACATRWACRPRSATRMANAISRSRGGPRPSRQPDGWSASAEHPSHEYRAARARDGAGGLLWARVWNFRGARAMSAQQRSGTVQSVDRAMAILELLGEDEEGFRLTDISRRTGLSASTVHRLLTTLEQRRFVQFDPTDSMWHVGRTAFAVGSAFTRQRN